MTKACAKTPIYLATIILLSTLNVVGLTSCKKTVPEDNILTASDLGRKTDQSKVKFEGEVHFRHVTQLTNGGENAEAYFSGDNTELIFQSTRGKNKCDQMYRMDVDGYNVRKVSTGKGRTTCGFIFPNSPKIIYSSTHATLKTCPPKPDYSKGYVWRLQPELDIYVAGPNGEKPQPLAPHPGYDAEAVVSPQGDRILFTSTRDGDVDIYSMKPNGTDVKRLTNEVGYDGGAFFSLDGTRIVYRAHHPKTKKAIKTYKDLLKENLVRPSIMELFVMNADGSGKKQITNNGAANFAPYFHPDGKRIVFSSNMDDPKGRNFDLYLINVDGTNLRRLTFNPSFDAFPMFSYDGTRLVFSSNRNNAKPNETNIFVADWIENVPQPPALVLRGQAQLDPGTWKSRVSRLSAPVFKGRGVHTPELDKAAKFIAQQFAIAGLQPTNKTSYLQTFKIPVAKTIDGISMSINGKDVALGRRPTAHSGSGKVAGAGLFVGYGLQTDQHDDYKKVGQLLKGKVALIFTGAPKGKTKGRRDDLALKSIIAKQQGASAVVLITPPTKAALSDELTPLDHDLSNVGIPVVHMTYKGAQAAFPNVKWTELETTSQTPGIPKQLAKTISMDVKVSQKLAPASNVVGRLSANADGKPTTRALVIGAHYDHLGLGGQGSRAPGVQKIHPGADDNASGVAGIIELAEALKTLKLKHDVYFVAFTAEESGLLGSTYFVDHPPIPKEKILAMMNFDMIGRLQNKTLTLSGVGSARNFRRLARQANTGVQLNVVFNDTGYGPSDHLPFYLQKIPVLNFHTGLHDDYHMPTDTVEKLNADGAVTILAYAFEIARRILTTTKSPQYIAPTGVSKQSAHHGHKHRSYGPRFGSIPSFAKNPNTKGALIAGVTKGSPAALAGLQKGDVIIQFGKYPIVSIREYSVALRRHKSGQKVNVTIMRKGKKMVLKATLGQSK